jgi:hypothetical protein
MSNHEKKKRLDFVDIFIALKRPSVSGEQRSCIRMIDKNEGHELDLLIRKLELIGGTWRIYKTVNQRRVKTAKRFLLHKLIDEFEISSDIDTLWKTCLLQRESIYGYKKFMLDVDTDDVEKIRNLRVLISKNQGAIVEEHKSPKGLHIITLPFDTREVCELDYVTLLRDGYYYVTSVNENFGESK